MPCPQPTEYNEAIQNLRSTMSDEELRRGEPALNALGLPMPCSGNFADVYKVHCPATGNTWAVKCFTREAPGLRERYREISEYLGQWQLPFMVDFLFVEPGIRIGKQWYPFLKMRWIEGLRLNQLVGDYLDKPRTLKTLRQLWAKLAVRLRDAKIAHGDLQHGNVLLVPVPETGQLSLKLIDYDGMYVPSLAARKSGEVGHPAYQHPQRLREGLYHAEVDRFSHLAIYTAIQCAIAGRRAMWDAFDNGDNLIFREADFQHPETSDAFHRAWELPDPDTHALTGRLVLACKAPLDCVPLLDEILTNGNVRPLPSDETKRVETILGGGRGVVYGVPQFTTLDVGPMSLPEPPMAEGVPLGTAAPAQGPWWPGGQAGAWPATAAPAPAVPQVAGYPDPAARYPAPAAGYSDPAALAAYPPVPDPGFNPALAYPLAAPRTKLLPWVLGFGIGSAVLAVVTVALMTTLSGGRQGGGPPAGTDGKPATVGMAATAAVERRSLDLTPYVNRRIVEMTAGGDGLGEWPAGLPRGEATFNQVPFRIGEAVVALRSRRIATLPLEIGGIAVNAKVGRLHVLHATQYGGTSNPGLSRDERQTIAHYRLNYGDGSKVIFPVVYGLDVRDWWNWERQSPQRARIAWTGSTAESKKSGVDVCLYQSVWDNPSPAKTVVSIDFLTAGGATAAPFCVAITVEAPDPAGGLTPPPAAPPAPIVSVPQPAAPAPQPPVTSFAPSTPGAAPGIPGGPPSGIAMPPRPMMPGRTPRTPPFGSGADAARPGSPSLVTISGWNVSTRSSGGRSSVTITMNFRTAPGAAMGGRYSWIIESARGSTHGAPFVPIAQGSQSTIIPGWDRADFPLRTYITDASGNRVSATVEVR